MSERPDTLETLQRWMLKEITRPMRVAEVDPCGVILPGGQQSSAERLAVYHNAYFARLLDVLRELFPCTRFAVGDELFDEFAIGYLQRHPPHSYTLARLSDNLVEYLNTTRPSDWGAFIVDVTRLEQAIDRVFDSAGPEGLLPFELPAQATSNLRLTFVPGFELLAFSFPVSTYYTEWKAGRVPKWPAAEEQFVALVRRDYIVRRYELSGAQFGLLSGLQRGLPLGEALAGVGESTDETSLDQLAASLRSWFAAWASQRFFADASEA